MPKYKTQQEIFDKVWDHFIVKGNSKSINDNVCVYDGTGCAIGCLLDPDDRVLWQKWHDVDGLDNGIVDIFDDIDGGRQEYDKYFCAEHLVFLKALQYQHDMCSIFGFHDVFRAGLTKIADRFGLTVPN